MNVLEKDKKLIAVWFSSGAASAVAAKKTIDAYSKTHKIRIINNPVKEEHPDNLRFLKDVEKWLGLPIEIAINDDFPNHSADEIWRKRKYMAGISGAPCTYLLKKQARIQWEELNKPDFHVLGFTVDEWKRAKRFKELERDNLIPILVNEMITKEECFKILQRENIKLPEIYSMGFPNANCIGCVKASSPTYWNLVRSKFPDIFEERAKLSREIGARLVQLNRKRIFLDELPTDIKIKSIEKLDFECGIFCEEK